jgi:hypothetical protein
MATRKQQFSLADEWDTGGLITGS